MGRVTKCYSTAAVIGTNKIGGLVGKNSGEKSYHSIIFQSYSVGTVTGNSYLGGLVGYNECADLIQCYSNSSASGIDYVGGLIGDNNGFVMQCYSTGIISGDSFIGGLVGIGDSARVNNNSVWDMETSGQTTSNGGIGLTTAEMQTVTTFLEAGWDFVDETANGTEDIWWIDEGQNYPRLWWELITEN